MLPALKLKTLLAAILAFLVIACNNKTKKTPSREVTVSDIRQENGKPEPPPPPKTESPKIEIVQPPTKCFVSDGLNYKTTIKISYDDNEVVGNVTSEELETGKTETRKFTGTIKGDQLNVTFKDDPPAIGTGSEWTNKPWTIKKAGGKEILRIVFNAKNYDSNKWENSIYEFETTDCK